MKKENETVMRNFSVVLRLYNRNVERAIEENGIHSSHFRLLSLIDKSDAQDSQTVLADKLGISPAAIAMTLKRLTKSGIVTREADEIDSRKNRVMLTEKGKELLASTKEKMKKSNEAMFRGLSAEEMKTLSAALEKIEENLRQDAQ